VSPMRPIIAHVYSRYQRKLADLPWYGKRFAIQLQARRFFFTVASCDRKIFVERLPDLAKAYARTTVRLSQARGQIGLALGGEAGARLAKRLAMPTSRIPVCAASRHIVASQHPLHGSLASMIRSGRRGIVTARSSSTWIGAGCSTYCPVAIAPRCKPG
jgi:hypothetical protein